MGKRSDQKIPTEKSVLGLISLCAKQGALKTGEFMADSAIKDHKAKLVIISKDASDNTKKGFKDACAFYKVPYREFSDRYTLGHSIGKEYRVSIAVTNEGLAEKIRETIDALSIAPDQTDAGGK